MALRERSKSCESLISGKPPDIGVIPTTPSLPVDATASADISKNTDAAVESNLNVQHDASVIRRSASVTPQIGNSLPSAPIDNININNNVPVETSKVNKGFLARLKWSKAAESHEKEKTPKSSKNIFFSKRARAAMKIPNVTTKKPPIAKKEKNKVTRNSLIVSQAIADNEFDQLVSSEEKLFIQMNTDYRRKLILKIDSSKSLRFENIIYKRLLKREWYRREKIVVQILKDNNIDADLLAVLISLQERRKRFKDVTTAIIELSESFVFQYDLYAEADKKTNDESRPASQMSGGGRSNADNENDKADEDDGERPPTPFSSSSNDSESQANADDIHAEDLDFDDPPESPPQAPVQGQDHELEEGEITPTGDDEEIPFDYENENPPRTTSEEGFFAFNCHQRLSIEQYRNIITQAMANAAYCHKPYPHMFPESGTILIYNVGAVKEKWHLKSFTEAQSEVRCTGWSFTPSTGGKKRIINDEYILKVDHFLGKNENTGKAEKEQPFDCWQYTTPNQQWQLLHFLGDTTHIASGYPHGNSKTGKPYIRSCPSTLRDLMRNSVHDKPTVVFKKFYDQMDEELTNNPQLQLVKGPRNEKQVKNARYRALSWGRLSSNTIANVVEMAIRLVYPGYFLPDSETPRSFIDAVGITKTNLFIYMENPLLFEEMGRIIKETGLVMRLRYDTTFKLGDFFFVCVVMGASIFQGLRKNIILGAYIHDSKHHDLHVDFFKKLWRNNKKCLIGGNFVLITDGEFHLTGVWPRLINLYCFEHLKKNVKRSLKGKGKLYRELCIRLIEELQQQTSPEEFDQKLADFLNLIDNEKVKKIFKYYADKVKDRCSRIVIISAHLPDLVLNTQGAESINAFIKRYKPKASLFPDEMIIVLFYLSQQQYTKIMKGYYQHPQGYDMIQDYFEKIRGKPGEVPSLAFVPGISQIVSYIRDKTTLPLMPNMRPSGPATPYMGAENPNVPNAMARELVQRNKVVQSPKDERQFLVHDLTDKLFAVYVKDQNLAKQLYECSCKSKNCIHLRAVFFYLGIPPAQIPFIADKDPLQSLFRNRNTNEKPAGQKAPRRGESKKDYESDGDMDYDNDNVYDEIEIEGTSQSRKKRKQQQQNSDEEINQNHEDAQTTKRRRRQIETAEPEISDMWTEMQTLPEAAASPQEIQLRNDIEERFTKSKNIFNPPELIIDPLPVFWNEIAENLGDVLFYPQLFKPNFYQVLPVIPENRCVIFATARDNYAVCYKETATSVIVYATDESLTENTPEEMAFTASHCARDEDKVNVTVYNSNDYINVNDPCPLAIAALKILCLINHEQPERFLFDLTNLEEINFQNLLQIYNSKTRGNADCFLSKKKHSFYCCCKKASFEPTVGRNEYLQIPKMVQCSSCENQYFSTCVNYNIEGRSHQQWICYNCSNYRLPPLSWGGQGASNTCPLDNILCIIAVMHQRHPDFIGLIGKTNYFEKELRNFLVQMGTTEDSIKEAKRSFITAVYDRTNLFGSEDMLILGRLLHIYGVETSFRCSKCNDDPISAPQNKSQIREQLIGDSVAATISAVINLENPFMVAKRCISEIAGEKCFEMLDVDSWSYVQEYPWIIPIGIANEELNLKFGLNELEQLPLKVEFKERCYQLGGITFFSDNHFVAIIPCESGFGYYDGLNQNHPITTLPESLKIVARKKPLIGHIIYFLVPEKKEQQQKQSKNAKGLEILALRGSVKVIAGDITKLCVDAIVNAAKETLLGGGGVDGAIHKAAGPQLRAECQQLNGCETGEAKITKAYNIKNVKNIIHTVGPNTSEVDDEDAEIYLYNCYMNSMKTASKNGLRSIAFPTISTGIYGYPKEKAAKVATEAVKDFLKYAPQKLDEIIFCVFDEEDKNIYKELIPKVFP